MIGFADRRRQPGRAETADARARQPGESVRAGTELGDQRIGSVGRRSGSSLKLPGRDPVTGSRDLRDVNRPRVWSIRFNCTNAKATRAHVSQRRRDLDVRQGRLVVAVLDHTACVLLRLFLRVVVATLDAAGTRAECRFHRTAHRQRQPQGSQPKSRDFVETPHESGELVGHFGLAVNYGNLALDHTMVPWGAAFIFFAWPNFPFRGKAFPRHAVCGITGIMPSAEACRIAVIVRVTTARSMRHDPASNRYRFLRKFRSLSPVR